MYFLYFIAFSSNFRHFYLMNDTILSFSLWWMTNENFCGNQVSSSNPQNSLWIVGSSLLPPPKSLGFTVHHLLSPLSTGLFYSHSYPVLLFPWITPLFPIICNWTHGSGQSSSPQSVLLILFIGLFCPPPPRSYAGEEVFVRKNIHLAFIFVDKSVCIFFLKFWNCGLSTCRQGFFHQQLATSGHPCRRFFSGFSALTILQNRRKMRLAFGFDLNQIWSG